MATKAQERGAGIVIVTGAGGGIGSRVMEVLRERMGDNRAIVGLDLECRGVEGCLKMDITSDESVEGVFERIAEAHGRKIASVVHLAAYFDFSGDESPMYDAVNVDGTRRLLEVLQSFDVEQFLFGTTMLVHAPTRPGVPITEDSPLEARWAYPAGTVIDALDGRAVFITALGIVLTCIYLWGVLERRDRTLWGFGVDSVAVIVVYAVGMVLLYQMA